jgi:hypothetical protein
VGLPVDGVVELLRDLVNARLGKTMTGFELSGRNALEKEGEQGNVRIKT